MNFRVGRKTQRSKECILKFFGVNSAGEAGRLVGRKVAWGSSKRRKVGKIVGLHGKNGHVRARFRKGLPGEALGKPVEIVG